MYAIHYRISSQLAGNMDENRETPKKSACNNFHDSVVLNQRYLPNYSSRADLHQRPATATPWLTRQTLLSS